MVATGNYLRWNTFFIVSLHVLEKILQKTWDNSTLRKNLLYKKSPSELWEKSIWSWRVFSDFSMKILTKFILGKVPCGSFPTINLVGKKRFSENHSNFWSRSTFSLRFFWLWSPSHFLSIARVFDGEGVGFGFPWRWRICFHYKFMILCFHCKSSLIIIIIWKNPFTIT